VGQATRTTRADVLTHEQGSAFVTAFSRFPVQATTLELVRAAMDSRDRYGISYWDAAIIEAARRIGCDEILSEDLSPTRDYDGIVVTNPFA
jgi:predicted nucleic acid-binding protein